MRIKVQGRAISATAEPIHKGYFVRCALNDVFGIQVGSMLEVDGRRCQVKYLIAGSPGETEVWAILTPVGPASNLPHRVPVGAN